MTLSDYELVVLIESLREYRLKTPLDRRYLCDSIIIKAATELETRGARGEST